jgi:hypothetical protein
MSPAPVPTPLADVAGHIVEVEFVGFLAADGPSLIVVSFDGGPVPITFEVFIAGVAPVPGDFFDVIGASVCVALTLLSTAGCLFPLGFDREVVAVG